MRTSLTIDPTVPGALCCPVCQRYTTKQSHTKALMQLNNHITKGHPKFKWKKKYCNGPLHSRPQLLDISCFRNGGKRDRHMWQRWCRECEKYACNRRRKRNNKLIPSAQVKPYLEELVERAGGSYPKAAKEAGVAVGLVYNIKNGNTQYTQEKIVKRILFARARLRRQRN